MLDAPCVWGYACPTMIESLAKIVVSSLACGIPIRTRVGARERRAERPRAWSAGNVYCEWSEDNMQLGARERPLDSAG